MPAPISADVIYGLYPKIYAYDRFWLRFANVPFDLSDLDVYEKHFTVMNYGDVTDFKQMFCHDFVK